MLRHHHATQKIIFDHTIMTIIAVTTAEGRLSPAQRRVLSILDLLASGVFTPERVAEIRKALA